MQRRDFIKGSALGAGALVLASQVDCGGKSVSGAVAILSGAVSELKPLFPNVPKLDQIIKLATDFNADWVAGKFDTARDLFDNLDVVVEQVINDLGINSTTRVKLLLATLGIGLRTIAALIAEQGQAQPIAARRAGVRAGSTVSRVRELADPSVADTLLKAVKH